MVGSDGLLRLVLLLGHAALLAQAFNIPNPLMSRIYKNVDNGEYGLSDLVRGIATRQAPEIDTDCVDEDDPYCITARQMFFLRPYSQLYLSRLVNKMREGTEDMNLVPLPSVRMKKASGSGDEESESIYSYLGGTSADIDKVALENYRNVLRKYGHRFKKYADAYGYNDLGYIRATRSGGIQSRALTQLRIGKRPMNQLRIGKRALSQLRLGKRSLEQLRIGKRSEIHFLDEGGEEAEE